MSAGAGGGGGGSYGLYEKPGNGMRWGGLSEGGGGSKDALLEVGRSRGDTKHACHSPRRDRLLLAPGLG